MVVALYLWVILVGPLKKTPGGAGCGWALGRVSGHLMDQAM